MRMRLPNGFGQISKISGRKLRNPYRAMVTVGKTEDGKYVRKILQPKGYFRTYHDAYAALVEYNQNPFDLEYDLTGRELYDKWMRKYTEESKPSLSSLKAKSTAFNRSKYLHDMQVRDIRAKHIKTCLEGNKPTTQVAIKILWDQLLDYAVEYEVTDKNYSRTFKLPKNIRREVNDQTNHMSFTDEEMQKLWTESGNSENIDTILIQCYTGLRPNELLNLKLENIDLDTWVIVAGSKTDNGKDRQIPIHDRIRHLVLGKYNNSVLCGCEYLISYNDKKMEYHTYLKKFKEAIEDLNIDPRHKPHDARKHFVTMAKKYNLDEYAIKRIVGHSISDLTESVYTDRNIDWLHSEMKKIKDV